MSHDSKSSGRPAPEPQHELDRLMLRAANDLSVHPAMFRMLWEAEELCVYVPPHPELLGEFVRSTDDGFTWCTFADAEGTFAPVFTSLACAEYQVRNLGKEGPRPMIASLPPKVLFGFLNDGQTTARIIAAGGGQISLPPPAVAALVSGKLTKPATKGPARGAKPQPIRLHPVADGLLPAELREAIADLCAASPVPLGVYVFHQADEAGNIPANDLRFLLWLRREDPEFLHHFREVISKLTPAPLRPFFQAVTAAGKDVMKFLQQSKPLWPEPLGVGE